MKSIATLAVWLVVGGTAFAGPLHSSGAHVVSGASPFRPDGCGHNTDLLDSEHDGMLAVDPSDADHLVGIWTQDQTLSSVVGVSFDGGASWQKSLVDGLSLCTGNSRWDEAFDPWVSVAADGTAYMSSVVNAAGPLPNPAIVEYGLAVSRSTDGGLTWTKTTFPIEDPLYGVILDKSAVTADVSRPGSAYVVTTLIPQALLLSKTSDHGDSWSAPTPIHLSIPGFAPFGAEVVSLRDGALLNLFTRFPLTALIGDRAGIGELTSIGQNELMVMRSDDAGSTWSLAEPKLGFPLTAVHDPDTGAELTLPWKVLRSAVGADGSLYVTWEEDGPTSRIQVSRSPDDGKTWSAPTAAIAAPWQVFKPTIAVDGDGTVAVTFYDFRNDVVGDGELTTDVWIRHSHDAGATWEETHVSGPFDLRAVPTSNGNYVPTGDYAGLVGLRQGFGAFFQRGNPPDTIGATDVFFSSLVP